jgi:hypothetical protein
MGTIEKYVKKHCGMPTKTLLGSCTMLETAGEGALGPFMELFHSSSLSNGNAINSLVKHAQG